MTRLRPALAPIMAPSMAPSMASGTLLAIMGIAALLVAGGITGCGTGTPPASGSPTASATTSGVPSPTASPAPSASPTPPATDPAIVFAADGIDTYLIGTQLADLQGRALVTGIFVNQQCASTIGAAATGRYAGLLGLTFTNGRLSSIRTTSSELVTPSGVKVGITLAEAQASYGGRGTVITSSAGTKALVVGVPASALAMALFLDETGTTIISMSGGEADNLEAAARTGQAC